MQIKEKVSKQIMSRSNGYINKGELRGTMLLPKPSRGKISKAHLKPQAHSVLEILPPQVLMVSPLLNI